MLATADLDTPDTDVSVVTIWADRLHAVSEKIRKINKKAVARGLSPMEMKVIGEYIAIRVVTFDGEIHNTKAKKLNVSVTNSLPAIEGHEIVAVRYSDGGIPMTYGNVPAQYADNDGRHCDHCHTQRERKRFAIIREIETGEFKLVGSTCYKDYFGEENAGTLHAFGLHYVTTVNCMLEEEDSFKMPTNGAMPLELFLARAAEVILRDGYCKADNDHGSTGMTVQNEWRSIKAGEAAIELAAGALKHFKAKNDNSGYILSIQSMIDAGHVGFKGVNIAASMIAVYRSVLDDKTVKLDEYFGELKQRYDLTLTITGMRAFYSRFGDGTTYLMRDNDGRSFKWATGANVGGSYDTSTVYAEGEKPLVQTVDYQPTTGDVLTLKGTIKNHDVYHPRGGGESVRTTELARCKVTRFSRGGDERAFNK